MKSKRAFDFVTAAIGLVVLAPLWALIALAIRLTMREPALFKQERPGLLERPFLLQKFRTMRTATDSMGRASPDRERLTRLGSFLRKTSLDEIPQLWNVLRGDMSLVGPRPLLMEYLPRYTPEQHQRHLVKPGITGWAQIHGRQDIPFSQRIELDNWYIRRYSFWLDITILLKTAGKALKGSGVRTGQNVDTVDDLIAPESNGHAYTPIKHSTA
jgi:lipopolysaccharide/colanic/teichoic acid biosynthesis glycosyltransferase